MRTQANHRAHWLSGASFLFVGLAIANWPAHALDATGVRVVPTYEAAGLYWSNPGANTATGCTVQFRKTGDSAWRQGLAMWFDASTNECRGSVVYLTPGTTYEAQMGVGGSIIKAITFTTWSNNYPVAKTITVPSGGSTLNITEGGSASGYVVYQGAPGAVLDANNATPTNVSVNASYVVVRGLVLKGAQQHGILIDKNQHDVIIEDNDISGWGRTRDGTWGTDMDSGIRAICTNEELTRVTIQRNRIHDPRYSANSWAVAHPAGPQGITFSYCGGNNVYRWNEITSSSNHYNDGMGGEDNFSTSGWPNKDSDIYGNKVTHAYDDGLEVEGGDQNVRVWGNYLDQTGTGISSTVDSVGPLYIFRNVWDRNEFIAGVAADGDQRQPMFKDGSSADFGNGRRYLFHNTMLQRTQAGSQYGLGGGAGVGGTGDTQLVHNTISMNNIYNLWKPNSMVYQVGSDNTFQNDMYNGNAGTAITSGINATPRYASGHGDMNGDGGMYQLAPSTPGYDGGVRIPNFNDDFLGASPDVGAAEAGAGAMKFGLAAATSSASPTVTVVTVMDPLLNPLLRSSSARATMRTQSTGYAPAAPTSSTPTSTPSTPAPSTGGSSPVSLTMDSSSYTVSVGQSVTFTVRLIGNAATPTGSVAFKASGNLISECSAIAASNGTALCTTTALAAGSYSITGSYSGDSTYGGGLAGPITQTVK